MKWQTHTRSLTLFFLFEFLLMPNKTKCIYKERECMSKEECTHSKDKWWKDSRRWNAKKTHLNYAWKIASILILNARQTLKLTQLYRFVGEVWVHIISPYGGSIHCGIHGVGYFAFDVSRSSLEANQCQDSHLAHTFMHSLLHTWSIDASHDVCPMKITGNCYAIQIYWLMCKECIIRGDWVWV